MRTQSSRNTKNKSSPLSFRVTMLTLKNNNRGTLEPGSLASQPLVKENKDSRTKLILI